MAINAFCNGSAPTYAPVGCRVCMGICPYTRKNTWIHTISREIDARDPTGLANWALLAMQKGFFHYPDAQDFKSDWDGGRKPLITTRLNGFGRKSISISTRTGNTTETAREGGILMYPDGTVVNYLFWMAVGALQILIYKGVHEWARDFNKEIKWWQTALLYGCFLSLCVVIFAGFTLKGHIGQRRLVHDRIFRLIARHCRRRSGTVISGTKGRGAVLKVFAWRGGSRQGKYQSSL